MKSSPSWRSRAPRAVSYVGSIADFEVARELVDCCHDSCFGGIDILVNCAGVAEPEGSSILDLSAEGWRELIDIHLTGTFNTCRHAAPRMVERGAGAIVNTSSHGYLGHYGGTGYPAGKGGVNSLTFAIAAELREHGIRVNAVCPGARTRLSTGASYEARVQQLHSRGILDDALRDASLAVPEPEHVGPIYAFLASDLARDITGRLFSATGGYVGLMDPGGSETLLSWRDASDGPASVGRRREAGAETRTLGNTAASLRDGVMSVLDEFPTLLGVGERIVDGMPSGPHRSRPVPATSGRAA